jgi:hypothetical protein
VSIFVYPVVRRPDLRRRAEVEVMWLCWNGTARERMWAEKEIACRNGSSG